jgi:hypothetical protein
METIQELIQKNKESFREKFTYLNLQPDHKADLMYPIEATKVEEHIANFAKDLIDAVIEDEREDCKSSFGTPFLDGYQGAKQDTIWKLKAIKEIL